MRQLKNALKSLTVRLILAICLAIIPVSLLCVVVTQLTWANARNALQD